MASKYSHEFIEAEYLKKDIKMLSQYVNTKTKNKLVCLVCDFGWKANYNNFCDTPKRKGRECPNCSNCARLTHDQAKRIYLKRGISLLSDYIDSTVKNSLECTICDYKWKATYHSLTSGHGCHKCAGRERKSHEDVKKEYRERNILLLSQYANVTDNNSLECLKCHAKWEANYNNFSTHDIGCPDCGIKGRSGSENCNYNHFLTNGERIRKRNFSETGRWREAVYLRDNFTCQCCLKRGRIELNAHHIKGYANYPHLRFERSNGVTLCQNCHKDYHHIYGRSATLHSFYRWISRAYLDQVSKGIVPTWEITLKEKWESQLLRISLEASARKEN